MYALVPLTRRPPGSSLHRRGCGRHLERPARAAVVRTTETWQDIRCLLERQARSRPRRGTPPAGEGTGPRADRCGLRTAHGPLQRASARVTDARPSCDDGEGARGGRGRVRRPTAGGGAPKAVLRWAHGADSPSGMPAIESPAPCRAVSWGREDPPGPALGSVEFSHLRARSGTGLHGQGHCRDSGSWAGPPPWVHRGCPSLTGSQGWCLSGLRSRRPGADAGR